MTDHPEARMYRAEAADRLLNDPTLKEALLAVERGYFEASLAAETAEEARRQLDCVHAVRALPARLRSWIMDGQQAARKPPSVV